jgi:hypothetical protein
MPKSHSKLILTTKVPSTKLLSLKFSQKRRRFSIKKKTTLSIISSSKPNYKFVRLEEKLYLKKMLEKQKRLLKFIKFKKNFKTFS